MSSPTTTATLIPNVDPNSRAWCLFIAAQSFNVTSIDGTPTTLSLQIVDNHYHQLISSATIVGFTLGFGVMLHIVLGINAVTDAKYRRQHIFLLNLASLFLISIRSILDSKIVNSSYNNIGPTFLNTWGQYPPSTWSPIVMSAAINPLIYATISSSLILQVRAAFAAEPITKRCLTCVGIPAAIGLCGFAVALAYYAIRVQFSPDVITPAWLYTSTRVYFMVFITACCFAFLYKLFGTIYRRRGMGFPANEFGPLQILLVGFLECLVVPMVIYIVDLVRSPITNFVGLAQIFLVCSLPLSALWASKAVTLRPTRNTTETRNTGGSVSQSAATKDWWDQEKGKE